MLIEKSTSNKHKMISNKQLSIHYPHYRPAVEPLPLNASSATAAAAVSPPSPSPLPAAARATSDIAEEHQQCYTQQPDQRHQQRRTCALRSYTWWNLSSAMAILGVIVVLPLAPHCEAIGYSYTRFRGPVSGPEYRIHVRDRNSHKRGDATNAGAGADDDPAAHLDYVAKPEYEFAYGVEDAQAHILHNRNEMRDGDAVKGVYSVVDPDGTLRVVKYTADDLNGFQAEVIMNGISSIHGQLQPDAPTTISNLDINNDNNNEKPIPLYTYPSANDNRYKHIYHPYQYTTLAPIPSLPTTVANDYNGHDGDNGPVHDSYSNGEDYQPQYEVHENSKDEGDHTDDGGSEEELYEVSKPITAGKNKDYESDGDDDDDEEYDDSDELEDYEEAVKNSNRETSKESDEYY